MNPVQPETTPEVPGLPALVQATLRHPEFSWAFPALPGLTHEQVRTAIVERLKGTQYEAVFDHGPTSVTYPDGPYTGPLPPLQPPLGAPVSAPAVSGEDSVPATPNGPLPNPRLPTPEQAAMEDLSATLTVWATRHALSSAEYYLYLSRMLAMHATTLVVRERQPQPRRPNA